MKQVDDIEVSLLLEAIRRKYDYDFSGYSQDSIKRRVLHCLSKCQVAHLGDMQHRLLHDQEFFEAILLDLTVNVTAMFRDPSMYRSLRKHVLPTFHNRPHNRVWHAGCATGEEVYSLAILLHESALLSSTRQYATDINEAVLCRAHKGIYPIDRIAEYTRNYQESGGKASFSEYYIADENRVILPRKLHKNLVFSDHNLVRDGVFAEMDLILCRNVLIYFGEALKRRVFCLFARSLSPGGFLCLGTHESLMFPEILPCFETICDENKIYRRTEVVLP